MEALNTLMSNMTNTLLQQVTGQVKRTMEGMSFLRQPLAQGGGTHDKEPAPREDPRPPRNKSAPHVRMLNPCNESEDPSWPKGRALQVGHPPRIELTALRLMSRRRGALFSLAEQKGTSLTAALKKVINFIKATEICVEGSEGNRRGRADKRSQVRIERGQQGGGWDQCFNTNPHSSLMKIKDHPMFKRPPPMVSRPKLRNGRKCCGFHE
ncbi:hypothetical protein Cgig2_033761 [Carnegiea gigantea]|uniref:Uncharacterized protein n=1 Tax=Carnegiea gigantea TaxID=171969 RepID=A0A9Q1KL23_9CARY|nr:hypothetical protein Cgig2_033761 [Carnegiea gigantea]